MTNKVLTIIIPVFNEERTIAKIIEKVSNLKIKSFTKEIIIINDGSTDNTSRLLKRLKNNKIRIINKNVNQGKGSAIKSALKISKGDLIIIQDADLEYDPNDIPKLMQPILNNKADVVFGSRLLSNEPHRIIFFWHSLGNYLLTFINNMITNLNLSDMETGYKLFTKDVANNIKLIENRFGFEPEFTVKVAKMNARIYEMGISYSGRSYYEGKKIKWTDGVIAIWCLIKYGLFNF